MKTYRAIILIFTLALGITSCEQERLEPVLTTAEGGGTLNTFMAYTIESTDPWVQMYMVEWCFIRLH